jgi:hypothetical protein
MTVELYPQKTHYKVQEISKISNLLIKIL